MKKKLISFLLSLSPVLHAQSSHHEPSIPSHDLSLAQWVSPNSDALSSESESNLKAQVQAQAQKKQLAQHVTWKKLMYTEGQGKSEVNYAGYFQYHGSDWSLERELNANIDALFQPSASNQSIRCQFPARSAWLMQQLDLNDQQLPNLSCPELDEWIGHIQPYSATLIYATDFMGNPSSMFGHTLLRLDPQNQKQLNLVSYAVNYAAMVTEGDDLAFAWKGLTGQYPGEYSLMPYYRKVKEYGDFESRDLWEYELALTPEETKFLVQHIWEMKHVKFPYYFINDNCAYRLLGLIDLVKPKANLQAKFRTAAIPVETIKAIRDQQLIRDTVYRPALETQLLAQAKQHGNTLAKVAHELALQTPMAMPAYLEQYVLADQTKILEMAYDHLYLQLISRQVDQETAQPRLRTLLQLRSQIDLPKQRTEVLKPKHDPTQSHHARHIALQAGQVQGQSFVELSHRQAYHDLIDPQQGLRTGTQLIFLNGSIQYRDDRLKLNDLDLLSVNSYNPITPFKMPLSWGFNVGWKQESLNSSGQFSEEDQHGVFHLKTQFGYTLADQDRERLCYAQLQNHIQSGRALDQGWRVGLGPTLGCQNIWNEQVNTLLQLELPYWEDQHQWQLKFNVQFQYVLNPQQSIRLGWEYQQQKQQHWDKWGMSLVQYF